MRLGLIARCDQSGLANQTLAYAKHLNPHRTLVIDVGHMADADLHCNKKSFPDRFPGATFVQGWMPDRPTLKEFMSEIDVLLGAECWYSPELPQLAHRYNVKAVLVPNYEFFERRVQADLYAAPSMWHYDQYPPNKVFLPVPIDTDLLELRPMPDQAAHFLHIAGRPAHEDRNGTRDLLNSLQHITEKVTVTVRCQHPGYVGDLIRQHNVRTPKNVTFVVESGSVDDHTDLYRVGDVLVMPRRFGGLCLPVNEALGAGMPVIMPDISPNNSWLPGEWLIPAKRTGSFMCKQRVDVHAVSPVELAQRIDQFASDADFYAKAVEEARRLRDELSWSALKPRYMEVLGK